MKTEALIIILFLSLLIACDKEEDKTIIKQTFSGYVQKGPFINGSAITIIDLDENLDQTGRSYNSSISDNTGKFEQNNISLTTGFASLRADGFYFNEVTGEISSSQLTLNALADITDINSVNVNLLTHMEKSRIEYLVKNKDYSFEEAKLQAQKDILKIFSIEKENVGNSEQLNVSADGDDNAILLAISTIIQGYRPVSEMSELIANIITDIKEDGQLNDSNLGSKLINDARIFDLSAIRANIEKRYSDLGITATIPDFEKYVTNFIENTSYKPSKFIKYPLISEYGTNILSDSITLSNGKINSSYGYSMAAIIPEGLNLKLILKGGMWWYRTSPEGPVNWKISTYNANRRYQEFESVESGKNCDVYVIFQARDTITIEYYENNAVNPTKVKTLITK